MKFNDFLNMSKLNEEDSSGNNTSSIATNDLKPRMQMPQITKPLYREFTNDLELNGHSIRSDNIKVSLLNPTQSEFNQDKINSIKTKMKDKDHKIEPIIISKDNKIVDGHHRWAAMHRDSKIPVTQINMKFDDLYKFLQNKAYVVNNTVNQ